MEAAAGVFSGEFDNVVEDSAGAAGSSGRVAAARMKVCPQGPLPPSALSTF